MTTPRRFDKILMQAPVPGTAVDESLLGRLQTWCATGAFPRMTAALAVVSIGPHAGLDAVACELGGANKLARLGRWRGCAWRLQILLRDHLPGRGPGAGDPWDCGWWRDGALVAAQAFRPRRATLLLLREPGEPMVHALLAMLRQQSKAYTRPLRVLVVSARPMHGVPRL